MIEYLLLSLILVLPIFYFKSNFTKVVIIIYWYPITIMVGLLFGAEPIRIISKYISIYDEFLPIATYSAICSYMLFIFTIWKVKKEDNILIEIPFGLDIKLFVFALFVISLVSAYPRATFIGSERFGSFGSLVVFAYAVIYLSKNKNSFINKIVFILVFLIFIRGERVDFLLMILLPFLSHRFYHKKLNKIYVIFFTVLIFLVGTYSGISRLNVSIDLDLYLNFLKYSFLNFGTAVDVVHVYLSSFYYYDMYGISFDPLLNVASSFIPLSPNGGVNSNYNMAILLRNEIDNLGGGLFYSVGVFYLGSIGVILMGGLYGLIYRFLFIRKNLGLLFLIFWLMQFRIQWYGLTYFGNLFWLAIFTMFTIFILTRALDRK